MSINTIVTKITEALVRFKPDREPDPLIEKRGYLGQPFNRVDGPLKVTGEARFIAEHGFDDLAYAVLVCSTIARGKIVRIDTSAAEKSAGTIAVITHENAPRMKKPPLLNVNLMQRGSAASDLPPLQDDRIQWDGQPVAMVVATTLEQAEHAASLVRVEYEMEKATLSFDEAKPDAFVPSEIIGEEPEVKVGDAEKALAEATFKVDQVYRTPRHQAAALELHATIAVWEGECLTLFDSTQFVNGVKHVIATMFDLDSDKVRVQAPFVGGGFGSKFSVWTNTALCVAAAKVTGRPVKLVLSREHVFRLVGGRTPSEQRLALGANEDGRFTALVHTGITATTPHAEFPEQFSFPARHLYASENFLIGQRVVNLDTVANSWVRAPGESIGLFAIESAIDELAHAMRIDPIDLRRINEPVRDPTKETEFSSRNLLEAYKRGADKFGWSARNPKPRSQRDGKWLVGQGMATAYYPVYRFQAKVRVRISSDGTALVEAAANEIGIGAATVQIQHAADRLGLPIDRITFRYGDTALPDAPIVAGGSSQTISIAAAVEAAVEKAHKTLLALGPGDAPLSGAKYEEVEARDGGLFRIGDANAGETYTAMLERAGRDCIEVEESSGMPLELRKYSMASYGAHFCEVRVNQESGEVRISRWLACFDCGRILNPKTATSQFRGAIVMGIGAALTEDTLFDERRGRIMNPTMAEYHVPVHLDVPHIDVLYLDIPDEQTPLGARGVAEIGITGAAAAVANAVFHATGKRIRDLPITLDKLL